MASRWTTVLALLAALVGCADGSNGDRRDAVRGAGDRDATVLFVCEHGNVKSLMAASYFNRIARQQGLRVHAVPRGTAPDSDTVPPAIAEALRTDGFEVSTFRPEKVSGGDVAGAGRIVTFGVELRSEGSAAQPERWDDVPPASVDYARSRDALLVHLRALAAELAAR